jgi:hypothetical protein
MAQDSDTPLSAEELNEANLAGAAIYGPELDRIGSISHLRSIGSTTQAVVDVGGFLGIGSKPVLIGLAQLQMLRSAQGNVFGQTSWTKEELMALPEHRE